MNIGYRDVNQDPGDDLRWMLTASPTGRNLLTGFDVRSLVNFDPNTASATQVYPDGATVIYNRAGTLETWAYTRETGWQQQ